MDHEVNRFGSGSDGQKPLEISGLTQRTEAPMRGRGGDPDVIEHRRDVHEENGAERAPRFFRPASGACDPWRDGH